MYQTFFNLTEPPFAITPDPRFLFLGRQHEEALAHLLYSVRGSSGFILLTGEVGAGKTTISRCLIQQVPSSVDVALIFNPKLSALELVASICDDLGISYPENATLKLLYTALNNRLLENYANNRTTVLILDEAQNLSVELLEQVRLLGNLETAKSKLLQIILIGQPELTDMLARSELRQLSQRITARYHIVPLSVAETRAFIRHRLAVAGCHQPIFGAGVIWMIHRAAQGIPRLINQICDRALLGAYTLERRQVDFWVARAAIKEVMGVPRRPQHIFRSKRNILIFLLFGLWMVGPSLFQNSSSSRSDPWRVSGDGLLQSALEHLSTTLTSFTQERRANIAPMPPVQAERTPAVISAPTQTAPTTTATALIEKSHTESPAPIDTVPAQPAADPPPIVVKQPMAQTTTETPSAAIKTVPSEAAADKPATTTKTAPTEAAADKPASTPTESTHQPSAATTTVPAQPVADQSPVIAAKPEGTTPVVPPSAVTTAESATTLQTPTPTIQQTTTLAANKKSSATPQHSSTSLETLFKTPSAETSGRYAVMTRLFSLWHVGSKQLEGKPTCEQATQVGFKCVPMSGDWNALRQLNRPALLTFTLFDKTPRYAVLTAIGQNHVTLRFARQEETFLLSEVARYWEGAFTVLQPLNQEATRSTHPAPTLRPILDDGTE